MKVKYVLVLLFFYFQLGIANASGIEGGSWGGKVRSGPGKEFSQVGSLNNGDPVILIESTSIFLDGYEWFKIIYNNNSVGYQWGGILCGFEIKIAGTYSVCEKDNRDSSSLNRAVNYNWVSSSNGSVMLSKMIQGGQNRNNIPLFLCRAKFNGGIHPGKINLKKHKGCHIAWGGIEYEISNPTNWEYAISAANSLANQRWQTRSGGAIPSSAVKTGQEANGVFLYTCRAKFNSGIHPGKIHSEFGGCNIPYGGREHTIFEYDVLVN